MYTLIICHYLILSIGNIPDYAIFRILEHLFFRTYFRQWEGLRGVKNHNPYKHMDIKKSFNLDHPGDYYNKIDKYSRVYQIK